MGPSSSPDPKEERTSGEAGDEIQAGGCLLGPGRREAASPIGLPGLGRDWGERRAEDAVAILHATAEGISKHFKKEEQTRTWALSGLGRARWRT